MARIEIETRKISNGFIITHDGETSFRGDRIEVYFKTIEEVNKYTKEYYERPETKEDQ